MKDRFQETKQSQADKIKRVQNLKNLGKKVATATGYSLYLEIGEVSGVETFIGCTICKFFILIF